MSLKTVPCPSRLPSCQYLGHRQALHTARQFCPTWSSAPQLQRHDEPAFALPCPDLCCEPIRCHRVLNHEYVSVHQHAPHVLHREHPKNVIVLLSLWLYKWKNYFESFKRSYVYFTNNIPWCKCIAKQYIL